MIRKHILFLLSLLIFGSALTSCSSGGGQSSSLQGGKPVYNETKSMVLDILHSKDGKEALKDLMKEPSFKQSIAVSDHDVSKALIQSFSDGQSKELLQKQIRDPKFAAAMVKATRKEHEEILKNLIKNPEYQKELVTILKSPEYQNMVLYLMKGPEYRQETMKVMTEALQNPEFRLVFMETVRETIQSGAGVSKMGAEGGKEKKQSDKKEKSQSSDEQQSKDQSGGEQKTQQSSSDEGEESDSKKDKDTEEQ